MSFNIDISVKSGEDVIARNEAALDKTADAGKRASAEVAKFGEAGATAGKKVTVASAESEAAVRKVSAAVTGTGGDVARLQALVDSLGTEIKQTGVSATSTGRSMADWTKGMEREADILERIRSPMREYKADLDSLDALLRRGEVTLSEYNAEYDRLIAKQGTMHGPAQQMQAPSAPAAASGASFTEWIGPLAAGGGLLAIGNELQSIVQTMHDIEDVSIKAANAAQKFVDAQHNVNTIIDEQLVLGEKIHATYATTIKLYDKVIEGSEGVALSHSDQLKLTEALGEAVQLSNKPVEEAASLMSRFSYAMASGSIEARALKNMMREVPVVADIWTAAFHTTRAGLMEMVKTGKVSIADLVTAITNGEPEISKRFQNIKRTNEQALEEFRERWQLAVGKEEAVFGSRSGVSDMFVEQFTKNMPTVEKSLADVLGKMDDITAAAGRADKAFTHWLVNKGLKDLKSDLSAALQITGNYADAIGRVAGVLNDPWSTNGKGFGAQITEVGKIKGPINEAKIELDNLHKVFAAGVINAEEYRQKYDALMTTVNDGRLPDAIKILEALQNPAKEYSYQLGGLNALWRSGSADAHQYNTELAKIAAAYQATAAVSDAMKVAEQHAMLGQRNLGGVQVSLGTDAIAPSTYAADAAATSKRISDAAYEVRHAGDEGAGGIKQWVTEMHELDQVTNKVIGPIVQHKEALEHINEALALNSITQAEATALTREANNVYNASVDALDNSSNMLKQILGPQKQYNEQLAVAAELLARGNRGEARGITPAQYAKEVDQLRASFLAASDEGKSFFGGMEAGWLKLKKESEAFGAAVAGIVLSDVDKLNDAIVTAANGGAVSWGQMVDSMIQDLEKLILKQLEVQAINAAIGAVSGGGIGGSLAGLATGGSWTVPGIGGTDTVPIHFMASPGEHISVTAPGHSPPGSYPHPQQGGSDGAAASSTPAPMFKIVNVVDPAGIRQAMDTPEGHQLVRNIIQASPAALRPRRGG